MSEQTTAIQAVQEPTPKASGDENIMAIMLDPTKRGGLYKVSELFAASQLVPQHFRGKSADCFIALIQAHAMRCNPLLVMQHIYIVKGRAGWSSQFLIAQANRSGKFKGSIKWRTNEGDAKTWHGTHGPRDAKKRVEWKAPNYEVTAWAVLAETGDEVSFTVTMQMAQDEGWTDNEKYKSMPLLMLHYRAATMLINLYAPETKMGLPAEDEVYDLPAAEFRVLPDPAPIADPLGLDDPSAGQAEEAPEPAAEPVIEGLPDGPIDFSRKAS